jgi:hypothetical protein
MLFLYKKIKVMLPIRLLALTIFFSACSSDDDGNITTKLESFGPSPALRGGQLIFIGNNLDQVTSIILPGDVEVTEFVAKTKDAIVIVIPHETAREGKIILKTPAKDIETISELGIAEPITIAALAPTSVLPGGELTISGTYLNLITEVIFETSKSVTEFESQSEEEIVLIVPEDAQTGFVVLSNGKEIPILVKSENPLTVIAPSVASISPVLIKAGAVLTITGANLDLTKSVSFAGGASVTTFESQTATEITVIVPSNAQDGKIVLRPLSNVEVTSSESITMVAPAITAMTPNPARTGNNVVITGTNLDLVNKVVFGGDKTGTIQAGSTATLMTVKIPADATEGKITVSTASNKSVSSGDVLALVKPVITNFTPTTVQTINNPEITINGTDLDIVSKVIFEGGWEATVTGATATQIVIGVVPGSVTGPFTLVTTNGTEVVSSTPLTIEPNVPNITGLPADAFIGNVLSITGTNMQVATDVIFPGNIKATIFGTKSPTLLEVLVPDGVPLGKGKIKFVTAKKEIYESAEITIKRLGVEPVQDQNLVFFNFNGGTGGKDSWWGGVSLVNDGNSIDGTSYGRINGSYNGWTDLFWRNSKNNFPGDVIGTSVADYVLKFDIKVVAPITGGNIKFRLEGSNGDFWYLLGPAGPSGATVPATSGWTTMTIPITDFKDNFGWGSNSPTDLSKTTGAFGAAFDNGSSAVNIMIDNVRFHKIN